jgi:hypothetical protein
LGGETHSNQVSPGGPFSPDVPERLKARRPFSPDPVNDKALVKGCGKKQSRQKAGFERLDHAKRPIAHQMQRAAAGGGGGRGADVGQEEEGGERACSSGQ